jgi:hypothetical protein
MSYYKHIKTVQAFQLGNIIPIAPRNFGGKAGLLFISRRIFHKILINIDHTVETKNLTRSCHSKIYDKILAKHQLIVKLLKFYCYKIPIKTVRKQALTSQAYIDKILSM